MGTGTNAGIIAIAPIKCVVVAFCSWFGMVGNLISGHAAFGCNFLRHLIKLCGLFGIRWHKFAGLSKVPERSLLFNCQLIK